MNRPVAVTGVEGQLGYELCRRLGERAIGLARSDLDITDEQQVARFFEQTKPAALINCAAYTAVDRAEQEPDLCYAINARAVEELAQAANRAAANLVQISSDYVFAGDASRTSPISEDETPNPVGVYARSKVLGEEAARTCRRHIIVRTCGLYGRRIKPTQSNFVDTMLRLARERRTLRVVGDQHCTPSSVQDVTKAVLLLVDREAEGTFHVVNQGHTTWYDFARKIFELCDLDIEVERISTEQYGAPAPRPRYSVLSTQKFKDFAGEALPKWEDALERYLAQSASDRPILHA
jgi:dTDP-4-dehydrorhamnose reductase